MKCLHFSICLILLGVLLSSCQVFPNISGTPNGSATEIAAGTATPQPTATLEGTETEETAAATEEPTIEATAETVINFSAQEGNPTYLPNFANPDAGCDWMGVAGQVFDKDGSEVLDLVIVIGSVLEENSAEMSSLTGTAPAYGPGGFEIKLSDTVLETSQTFWIEVRSAEGIVLSEKVFFDTFADCEKNLILINFIQQPEEAKNQPTPEVTPTLEAYP